MATSALRWFQAAIVLQVLLLAYWLTIEVVGLFPWNDLTVRPDDYDLPRSVALNTLPQLACMALFALGIRLTASVATLGYAIYLGVQLWVWWEPFLLKADANWYGQYVDLYSRTIKVLPSEGLRLAPDAQHLTLQALTLVTLLVMAMAVARMRYL
jgi:hypothetical protein